MGKQIKAALIGMVLAVFIFVATPANAQNCSECPQGWTSLDTMFALAGCEYHYDAGYVVCTYIPIKMNMNLQPGEQICESREQAPKPSEPVNERKEGANPRSDSR